MDSTEAQLRFGAALSDTTDPSHPSHPLHASYVRNLRERATREEQRILQTIENRRRTRTGWCEIVCCSLDLGITALFVHSLVGWFVRSSEINLFSQPPIPFILGTYIKGHHNLRHVKYFHDLVTINAQLPVN